MDQTFTTAKKIAAVGIFAAAAAGTALLERALCAALPFPPGVRPGLSNVIVLFAAATLGYPCALGIAVVKAGFTLLVAGPTAGLLSLAGGVISVSGAAFLLRFAKKLSFAGVSVAAAVLHNAGQLAAVALLTGSAAYFSLAPVLFLAGVGFGLLTGTILNVVMPALVRQFPFMKKGR